MALAIAMVTRNWKSRERTWNGTSPTACPSIPSNAKATRPANSLDGGRPREPKAITGTKSIITTSAPRPIHPSVIWVSHQSLWT